MASSDSDFAFRLQMEEAIAASRLQSPPPPPPPIVATSGYMEVVQDDRNGSSKIGNRGFDFRRAIGEGTSKGKGKINETVVSGVRNPNNIGIGNSSKANSVEKLDGNVLYRLYFKGLVSEADGGKGKMVDLVVGFGIAICDQSDNLLFEMKGPLVNRGTNRQGAEIMALTRGLTEAMKLGVKHISLCCDSYPIFQYVTGRWTAKQKKVSLLLDDLYRIRQQFTYSRPFLIAGQDVKFAYKLARESILSQVTTREDPRQAALKEECTICFNDVDAARMFSVDKCRHRFCFQCVKQHVEVKLLHGMVPKCPGDECKSVLVMDACAKLLTPKLIELWKQRIKENAVPVTERVYCPYPRCSALMSKTKISVAAKSLLSLQPNSGVRRCVECRGLFCVNCKVPWHGKVSCAEYKRLHPNPPVDDAKLKSLANNKMWRQCGKCQHMIELTQGCNHITCRCGHEFCYTCGAGWNKRMRTCVKGCPFMDEAYITHQEPVRVNVAPMPPPNFFVEDDDEEDYDYGYDEVPFHFLNQMNNRIPEAAPFDPFFDLPDGVIFTPDMLSPRSRQRFELSDSDDPDEETDGQQPHIPEAAPFDPFFDLPDGVIFTPDMLSPRSRQRFELSDSDEETDGQPHIPRGMGNPISVGYPWADDDDPYFGKYGKYAKVYDDYGREIEDYTNPFHSDYYDDDDDGFPF